MSLKKESAHIYVEVTREDALKKEKKYTRAYNILFRRRLKSKSKFKIYMLIVTSKLHSFIIEGYAIKIIHQF